MHQCTYTHTGTVILNPFPILTSVNSTVFTVPTVNSTHCGTLLPQWVHEKQFFFIDSVLNWSILRGQFIYLSIEFIWLPTFIRSDCGTVQEKLLKHTTKPIKTN